MKLYYTLISCFLVLSICGFSQKSSQDYVDKGERIVFGWFNFNPNRPLRIFTEAIKLDSTNVDAYYSRGLIYIYQKQNKELGEQDLMKAHFYVNQQVEIASSDSLLWKRGFIRHYLGLNDEACNDFNSAGEIAKQTYKSYCIDKNYLKSDSRDHLESGKRLSLKGKYSEAFIEYNIAIELYPENYKAYLERGNLRKLLNELKLADSDFYTGIELTNKAIENNLKSGEAYFYRGRLRHSTGNFEGACEDFKKSRELGYSIMKHIDKKLCKL